MCIRGDMSVGDTVGAPKEEKLYYEGRIPYPYAIRWGLLENLSSVQTVINRLKRTTKLWYYLHRFGHFVINLYLPPPKCLRDLTCH